MLLFPYAHATHPQWPMAAALVLAQLKAQMTTVGYADMPSLGVLYLTDHYAPQAQDILDELQSELPMVTDWVGSVGVGIVSNQVEYWDEPAMTVMLLDIPQHQYRVFSGVSPLGGGFSANAALVHGDAHSEDLVELVREFAARMHSGQVFGGIASSRTQSIQIACSSRGNVRGYGLTGNVFNGGMSGVAFDSDVAIISKVSQGCLPISKVRTVTMSDHNVVLELDGLPALDVMLQDLQKPAAPFESVLDDVRTTLVGLVRPEDRQLYDNAVLSTGIFGKDATVRHVIGLDPVRRGVAVAAAVAHDSLMVFCKRNSQNARIDLKRMCTEVREELEPLEYCVPMSHAQDAPLQMELSPAARRISGAIYVSCTGRGGGSMGALGSEMQMVRNALGDVPLVGFYAGGEIGQHHIYSYTGVLTVFTDCGESG